MGFSPSLHESLSVISLGLGTLLSFTGYDTQSFISESVVHSVNARDPERIGGYAGYYGATVMYASYTVSTLIAPYICYKIGAKWSLFAGSTLFTLYLCGFLYLNTYLFYTFQVLLGVGFAMYFTGQGQYMAEHSTRETISRNSVLLGTIGNQSMLLGALTLILIYAVLPPSASISTETHTFRDFGDTEICAIFLALIVSSIAANIVFASLPTKQHNSLAQLEPVDHATFSNQMSLLWETFTEKRIFTLLPFFIFNGLHISFWLIVFPTSFAFSHHLAHNHLLPAYYSMAIGVGNVLVGVFIHQMSKRNTSFGLVPTMFIQIFMCICMYILTILSTPSNSTMYPTTSDALWIQPSIVTVLLAGVLHGMIDCCFCTMRSMICTLAVPKKRLQAFCVSKLFQSLASCSGAFIGAVMPIYGWVSLLLGVQLIASICFYCVSGHIHNGEMENSEKTKTCASSP